MVSAEAPTPRRRPAGVAEHAQPVPAGIAAAFPAPVPGEALDAVEHVLQAQHRRGGDEPLHRQPARHELQGAGLLRRTLAAQGETAVVARGVQPSTALRVGAGVAGLVGARTHGRGAPLAVQSLQPRGRRGGHPPRDLAGAFRGGLGIHRASPSAGSGMPRAPRVGRAWAPLTRPCHTQRETTQRCHPPFPDAAPAARAASATLPGLSPASATLPGSAAWFDPARVTLATRNPANVTLTVDAPVRRAKPLCRSPGAPPPAASCGEPRSGPAPRTSCAPRRPGHRLRPAAAHREAPPR